jgi:peptide/nickel transport system substrate-binding protein
VNTTNPILGDVKVRKAISLALDRQRMINTGVWGKSVPANATGLPVGPFVDWIDKSVVDSGSSWIGMDPDKSKAMLDEAGYKLGADGIRVSPDGKPLSFTIMVTQGWDDWVSACQTIAENLKDVGIDVQVKQVAESAWTNATFAGQFDMSLASARVTATPFEFYQSNMTVATVKPIDTPAPSNQQRYGDPKADELLGKFAASADPAEQKAIMVELEKMFAEAAPLIPLYEQPDWGLYNTRRITGFPTADNPYAPLNTRSQNTTYLVFPQLAYR